ncbi:MAG: 4Fe-4S dicluster domain-containing protein [Gammaproteobacteria bacterium]
MPKIVRMVAEIVAGNCTGCDLCTKVCPTVAMFLRDRRADEPGRGKKIVDLNPGDCYNAQNCLEVCPEDAIVMRELEQPFEVAFDIASVDPAAVKALCAKAGFPPDAKVCVCTLTSVAEMAAAVLAGADTPARLSRATGARTGCSEICAQPFLAVLAAAGHGDAPAEPPRGFQVYGMCGTLFQHARRDGTFPEEIVAAFPAKYPINRELPDIARLKSGAGKWERPAEPAKPE